jgi:WD40 repeat protein
VRHPYRRSGDTTIKIWDPETGTLLHTLSSHISAVACLVMFQSSDGACRLVSGGADGRIIFWCPEEGRLLYAYQAGRAAVSSLLVLSGQEGEEPGSQYLASAHLDGRVLIWELGKAHQQAPVLRPANKLG